ncbi:alpha/beta hydrolase [uncultured Massilia sp.]|uniref:alpha/beta hydrolase n=1 Tax=uncultured Massilia sp. TaxID=169973 RepID=UPI00258E7881|nr:alpha/beta hydrolase [uncultured Massilia sp.]
MRAYFLLAVLGAAQPAFGAEAPLDPARALVRKQGFAIQKDITYLTASGKDIKLDVYRPPGREAQALPVVLYIHGGGWVAGSRERASLSALTFLHMGFAVVNVSYRLANTALAPAAVEDTLCALQWIGLNAKKYGLDASKVVTSGDSAGGHLALATAMIPSDSPFTNQCAANEPAWSGPYANAAPKVGAVVNFYGITDVAEMLQGPTIRSYAVAWFGSMPGREALARQLSPLSHVRPGGPPVFTVHGDADPLVPHSQALRLKAALDAAGVKNVLHTIPGGGHGGFSQEQTLASHRAIHAFLDNLGLAPAPASKP